MFSLYVFFFFFFANVSLFNFYCHFGISALTALHFARAEEAKEKGSR